MDIFQKLLRVFFLLEVFAYLGETEEENAKEKSIMIFKTEYYNSFRDDGLNVSLSSCMKTLPSEYRSIASLRTEGNCINFFKEEECKGKLVRLQPGIFSSYSTLGVFKPKAGTFSKPNSLEVKSIGPCFDQCDPRNWVGADRNKTTTVTFWDDDSHSGNQTVMKIDKDACVPVPTNKRFRLKSLMFDENAEDACIELHLEPHCGSHYIIVTPEYPKLDNLFYLGMGVTGQDGTDTLSVSLCGYQCGRTIDLEKIEKEEDETLDKQSLPAKNSVTLYDYRGFHGNAFNLNISEKCTNVTGDYKNQIFSVRTYQQCVILYEDYGCEDNKTTSVKVQTEGMPLEYYKRKILAGNTLRLIRSIKLCPEDYEYSSPLHDDSSNPESSLSWVLIVFLGLIFMSVFALCGAFSYKSYESFNYERTRDRFKMVYNNGNQDERMERQSRGLLDDDDNVNSV